MTVFNQRFEVIKQIPFLLGSELLFEFFFFVFLGEEGIFSPCRLSLRDT